MLEFPLSIGNYWTFMEGSGYSIICSVEAQETVCVTAGTFADCYRVAMVFVGGEVYSTTYIWLANNVGMVKEVSGSTTEELVSKNF
jgi:hypothetical protein